MFDLQKLLQFNHELLYPTQRVGARPHKHLKSEQTNPFRAAEKYSSTHSLSIESTNLETSRDPSKLQKRTHFVGSLSSEVISGVASP
jgi:DNA/RNA endonuclease YhcR with UshA esterase domain